MLIVNNSGLVYEEKKAAQSSQLLVFVLCISVIYSKVTKSTTTTTTTTISLHLFLLIHGEASTIQVQNKNLESLNWQVVSNGLFL